MVTALQKAEEVSKKATEKALQAKLRLAKIKALEETKKLKEDGSDFRKAENRRKYLAGAFLLDKNNATPLAVAFGDGQTFEQWLGKARDDERALFGLAPLPKPATPAPAVD